MKKYLQISLKWFLTIAVFQIVSVTDAAVRTDAQGGGFLGKTLMADSGQFDGNRIRDDLENNGMLVSHSNTRAKLSESRLRPLDRDVLFDPFDRAPGWFGPPSSPRTIASRRALAASSFRSAKAKLVDCQSM